MGAAAPIEFALWGHSIGLHNEFASGRFCPAHIRENIFLRPCFMLRVYQPYYGINYGFYNICDIGSEKRAHFVQRIIFSVHSELGMEVVHMLNMAFV